SVSTTASSVSTTSSSAVDDRLVAVDNLVVPVDDRVEHCHRPRRQELMRSSPEEDERTTGTTTARGGRNSRLETCGAGTLEGTPHHVPSGKRDARSLSDRAHAWRRR